MSHGVGSVLALEPRCDLKHSFPGPRPLRSECATLMGALIAAIIWIAAAPALAGGGAPSGSLLPAWTCRVAGSGLVFGLVFFGEDADGGALRRHVRPTPSRP